MKSSLDKKKGVISCIQIIEIIHNSDFQHQYYKILLHNDIELCSNFPLMDAAEFRETRDNIGLMYSELFIAISKEKELFLSLDDFMNVIRVLENGNIDIAFLEQYSYKKGEKMTKEEFMENQTLYCDEIFLANSQKLIDIDFNMFEEGFFYFNEPSTIVLGASFSNMYFAISYYPYS